MKKVLSLVLGSLLVFGTAEEKKADKAEIKAEAKTASKKAAKKKGAAKKSADDRAPAPAK